MTSEMSEEQKRRSNARSYVNVYIRRGLLERGLCEVCGAKKVQPHHEDYGQPLKVRWFCRRHHLMLHGKEERVGA
jgi:hypothetical protein